MEVKVNRDGRQDLENLDNSVLASYGEARSLLRKWPAIPGVKHLTGRWKGFCRIKFMEDWRIIFRVVPDEVHPDHLTVVRIRHRSVVYE